MAQTLLSDVIVPSVFDQYVQLLTAQRSAFVQSGVAVVDAEASAKLAGGGKTFNMPFFNDLADTESNVSSDTGAAATPQNITTGQEVAIRHSRNQVWGAADLVSALAGADPLAAIASRVADYWVRQRQAMLIRSIRGIIADNVANDSSDMVKNICIGASGSPGDANLFGGEAFIDALQTLGDAQGAIVAVAMHSVVYARAKKLNLIDFLRDSDGTEIETYMGRRVIVDDGLPVVTNGSNLEYSTYCFGAGAVRLGVGTPRVPAEVERDPKAGNGGGAENLISRVEWLIHPNGFAWLSGSMAGQSPTFAELIAAANWNRVVERKLVRIAELRTNG